MKYLHIWNVSSPKSLRCVGFTERLSRLFDANQHYIYINGPQRMEWKSSDLESRVKVFYEDQEASDKEKLRKLCDIAGQVDCIILHAMYDGQIWRLRALYKIETELNKKVIWAVWGHDVYDAYWKSHRGPGKHLLRYIQIQQKEKLRRKIIKNVTCIMALPGDYRAIKQWYDTDAKHVVFNQVSYGGNELEVLPENKNDVLKVVIGHDAYPHCRHQETMDILKKYDDGKLEVYCPLPYSGKEPQLVSDVKQYGKKLFGDRFHSTNDMSYSEYCRFVNSMDVALFNHNRQMAEGNVLMYLYYGKKVFVSEENCVGEFFHDLGTYIYSMNELGRDALFTPLGTREREENKKIIEYNLGDEALFNTWNEAFDAVGRD